MKAFYGLMLETKKEERVYQFNAPIGVSYDEIREVLNLFNGMIDEMAKNAEEIEKAKEEESFESIDLVEEPIIGV